MEAMKKDVITIDGKYTYDELDRILNGNFEDMTFWQKLQALWYYLRTPEHMVKYRRDYLKNIQFAKGFDLVDGTIASGPIKATAIKLEEEIDEKIVDGFSRLPSEAFESQAKQVEEEEDQRILDSLKHELNN